jgi:hypothetical protein
MANAVGLAGGSERNGARVDHADREAVLEALAADTIRAISRR